jgi:hypothetical protein
MSIIDTFDAAIYLAPALLTLGTLAFVLTKAFARVQRLSATTLRTQSVSGAA